MEDVFKEGLMIVGSYIAILVIGFAAINFFSAGFLMKFLKVRASRGKLVLIKVKSVTDQYYKTGLISEKSLKYQARGQKEKKNITIPKDKNVIYRAMNVWCVDVDEETNAIITPEGKEIDTYDAEKYEQLIMRALYKPALLDKNEKIMLIMIGACILGIAILFFYVKNMDANIFALMEQVKALKDVASSSVGVVG